jgi:2-iminoacetate synthase
MVPLYISNYCDGSCQICSLRKSNSKIQRIKGTIDQITNQLQIILEIEKIECVSFVSGELRPGHDRDVLIENLCRCVQIAHSIGFKKIFVNVGELSHNEINKFRNLNLASNSLICSIFQETYDNKLYDAFFNAGKENLKSNYTSRRKALNKWIEAGFTGVNLGILLGLGPPKDEIEALIHHAMELREYGAKEIVLSIPRIRGCAPPCPVSDEEFRSIVVSIAKIAPWAKIVITTRESTAMIRDLLPMISIISPGSSDVLAYTESGKIPNNPLTSQFVINKYRNRPSEVLNMLQLQNDRIKYYTQKE